MFSGNAFQIRHRLVLCRGEAAIAPFVINASLPERLARAGADKSALPLL